MYNILFKIYIYLIIIIITNKKYIFIFLQVIETSQFLKLANFGNFIFNLIRYIFWIFFANFFLHFLYFNAIQYHPEVISLFYVISKFIIIIIIINFIKLNKNFFFYINIRLLKV